MYVHTWTPQGSWKEKHSNLFGDSSRYVLYWLQRKIFDPLCSLLHVPLSKPPPLVLLDEEIAALEGANLPSNPVSVSWRGPAFTVIVRKVSQNSRLPSLRLEHWAHAQSDAVYTAWSHRCDGFAVRAGG